MKPRKPLASGPLPPWDQAWRIPKKGANGEYYPIVRVGRHIPFGYSQDEDDKNLLIPIPSELELLETAKKYLKEYSLRMVARWLTEQSGRYISHVGLKKRISIEYRRRQKATIHLMYARRYKEAAETAKKLQENRLGGIKTRLYKADSTGDNEGGDVEAQEQGFIEESDRPEGETTSDSCS